MTSGINYVYVDPALFVCLFCFVFPFYNGWVVYFIYKLVCFGRKRIKLEDKEGEENIYLRYHHKTEYYKYALMLAISVIELTIFGIIGTFKLMVKFPISNNATSSMPQNVLDVTILNIANSLLDVATLVSLSLINILTIYMSYVCRSYTEFSPIKRKLRNTTILTLILILSLLTIIGILIVDLVTQILSVYEYIKLIKNSKQLYNLLKLRNKKLLTEDYLVYQKQKKLVKRYKWFTIFNLIALFGFICASLLDTLHYITFSVIFLLGFGFDSNEKLTTITNSGAYKEAYTIILWVLIITFIFPFGLFSVNIIWTSLVQVAEKLNHKISGLCGKGNKNNLTERLLS